MTRATRIGLILLLVTAGGAFAVWLGKYEEPDGPPPAPDPAAALAAERTLSEAEADLEQPKIFTSRARTLDEDLQQYLAGTQEHPQGAVG